MPVRDGVHVAAGQAAVRRHPLEDHHLLARRLQDGLVVHRQEAADVHEAVLLRRHRAAVEERHHLAQDRPDRLLRVARLALLDEEGVLHRARGVAPEADAELVADLAHGTKVVHRHRLPAGHVHGDGDVDVRDVVRPDALDDLAQLDDVDVALERMERGGVVRFIDDDVDEVPPCSS